MNFLPFYVLVLFLHKANYIWGEHTDVSSRTVAEYNIEVFCAGQGSSVILGTLGCGKQKRM